MKKDRRAQHELNYLKKLLPKLKHQAAQTKSGKLWHLESVVRKKLKDLRTLSGLGLGDYRGLYDGYVELLGEVSERLLEHYNKTNKTEYKFEEIVPGNFKSYLNSGIISVLVTNHIPKIVAEQFSRLLPENPKDFYPGKENKAALLPAPRRHEHGKTYNALQRLKQSGNGLYLAPLRILPLNFERLNSEGVRCNLLTGEEEIRVTGRAIQAAPSKGRYRQVIRSL